MPELAGAAHLGEHDVGGRVYKGAGYQMRDALWFCDPTLFIYDNVTIRTIKK
jgi:hypothetical protein